MLKWDVIRLLRSNNLSILPHYSPDLNAHSSLYGYSKNAPSAMIEYTTVE